MNLFKKIRNWWRNNQEKNSGDYLERESLRKDLIDFKKTLKLFSGSETANSNGEYLERLILIQNMRMQKKMNSATGGLKTATWILAIATGIFAWATIIDSPNSNYFIQSLQGIVTSVVSFFLIALALTMVWVFLKFIWKLIFNSQGFCNLLKIKEKNYKKFWKNHSKSSNNQ